jgi:hypothetical protein
VIRTRCFLSVPGSRVRGKLRGRRMDHGQEEHGCDIPSPSASWDFRESPPSQSPPRMDHGQDPITKFFPPASERGLDARLLAAALAAASVARPKKKRFRDSRSKYEMTDDLKKRGIKVPKSSTKEVSLTSKRLASRLHCYHLGMKGRHGRGPVDLHLQLDSRI